MTFVVVRASKPLPAFEWRLAWRVSERKTPLYDEHVGLGAKMVPFAGWLMPVQ